jgi:hypothetical protein
VHRHERGGGGELCEGAQVVRARGCWPYLGGGGRGEGGEGVAGVEVREGAEGREIGDRC